VDDPWLEAGGSATTRHSDDDVLAKSAADVAPKTYTMTHRQTNQVRRQGDPGDCEVGIPSWGCAAPA